MKNCNFLKHLTVACSLLLLVNLSFSQTKKNTYEVGGTKYIQGETYKTTGQPKVQRSASAKQDFLKDKGYNKTPKGYQVDHVKPLSQGGKDEPSNMQLISTEQHKLKTASERKQTSNTYNKSLNNYNKPKTTNKTNSPASYNYSKPKSSINTSTKPKYNYSSTKSTTKSSSSNRRK